MHNDEIKKNNPKTNHIHISKVEKKARPHMMNEAVCGVAQTETAWKQNEWAKNEHACTILM